MNARMSILKNEASGVIIPENITGSGNAANATMLVAASLAQLTCSGVTGVVLMISRLPSPFSFFHLIPAAVITAS